MTVSERIDCGKLQHPEEGREKQPINTVVFWLF